MCVCLCVFTRQEKIAKEMNYILSNQDTVLAQITQLESSITQTEVNHRLWMISILFWQEQNGQIPQK